jgi:hypothetical protein
MYENGLRRSPRGIAARFTPPSMVLISGHFLCLPVARVAAKLFVALASGHVRPLAWAL